MDEHQLMALPDKSGNVQSYQVVTEPGVWNIILSSNKAKVRGSDAWRLKRWVTHEVLPALRKKGKYEMTQTINRLTTQTEALTIQTNELTELTDMLMNRRFHKVATKLLGDRYVFKDVKKLTRRLCKKGLIEWVQNVPYIKKESVDYVTAALVKYFEDRQQPKLTDMFEKQN